MEYAFAGCRLDTDRHKLVRDGEEVHLEPQVFALLELLAHRAGTVVTRDEIVDQVWGGRIVSEATISARISAARAAVGDTGHDQRIIRTVTRVGLKCVAEVERVDQNDAPAPVLAPAAPPPVVRMTSASDGSGIAWTQSGEGPPLLRAGHWLTHLELDVASPIWGPWLERLGRGRRLVRYDLRGTGMSPPDCGSLSLETFVDDLRAVVDAAGLEKFQIFATSQSMAVSCAFAAQYPGRVERIFSYGGFAEGSRVRDGGEGRLITDAIGTMLRKGWAQPDGGFMQSFAAFFMPSATLGQVRSFVDLQIASATPERAVEVRDVISRFDVKDILPQVEVPVFLAHSGQDSLHPFSQGQLLARLLPDAQLHMLDSVNHLLLPNEPAFAEMMDAMDAFLEADRG